jgi:alpha-tubulin suppressor-like RCC1 family protein
VTGLAAAAGLTTVAMPPIMSPVAAATTTVSSDRASVLAWGANGFGQLGAGAASPQLTPRLVAGLPDRIIQLAAGNVFSMALIADGTVRTWGSNGFGQLGIGAPIDVDPHPTPVQPTGLTGVVQIAAGRDTALALRGDGTVWAWGLNNNGQVGDGAALFQSTPRQVPGLAGVTKIAAGDDFGLALLADRTVRAWGADFLGQLGDGREVDGPVPVPVVVSGLTNVVDLEGGGAHSLALLADGTLRAWGNDGSGQIGDGGRGHRDTAVPVTVVNHVVQIGAGNDHSVALEADGTVWAWGFNGNGQVGGPDRLVLTPRRVPELSGVDTIAVGGAHNLVRLGDGSLWAWGFNLSGGLGDGTRTDSPVPVRVTGIGPVALLAGGGASSFAGVARPDFDIALNPASGSVAAGGTVTAGVTLTPASGFTGVAGLTVSGLPDGVTAAFTPSTVSATSPATLTVNTAPTAPAGTFPITITATAGNDPTLVRTATYSLTITAAPTFAITLNPIEGEIIASGTVTTKVTLIPLNGFTSTATLSVAGLPDGMTATFSAARISAGHPVTLTLSTERSPSGNYQVAVTATANATSQTVLYDLTISGPADPGGS